MHECIICGLIVNLHGWIELRHDTNFWTCEYRAVYHGGSKAQVSGIGRLEAVPGGGIWLPQDSSKRWDDEDCRLVKLVLPDPTRHRYPTGFLIHESCWSILQKASKPANLDIDRLLEVCYSLPSPKGHAYWGHSYGGLWTNDHHKAFQWQEEPSRKHIVAHAKWKDANEDPFNTPDILRLLSSSVDAPPEKPLRKVSRDCFTFLPRELLDKISALLTTRDALNLRLASASFLPIFTSNFFWASRFARKTSQAFIFESQPQNYVDWRTLYRLFRRSGPSGFRNRYRVWNLAKIIVDITQRELSIPSSVETSLSPKTFAWVYGNVQSKTGNYYDRCLLYGGCHEYGTESVAIPVNLKEIGITIKNMFDGTYITGLRLTSNNGIEERLGYIAKHSEVTFPITSFYGFKAAVGFTGIKALKPVAKDASHHRWAGCATEMLITNKLTKSDPVQWLSISYDGFKIVGIGIDKNMREDLAGAEPNMFLKDALWYPQVPSEQSYISESCPRYSEYSTQSFCPLMFVDFGGSNGKYLPYISRVVLEYSGALHCIEFHYAPNPFNLTFKRLGLSWKGLDVRTPLTKVFEMNGGAGERITAVEVVHKGEFRSDNRTGGGLKGVRFIVNETHKHELTWSNAYDELQRLDVTNGTVITGLYTYDLCLRNFHNLGVLTLGLISQAVEGDT